MFIFVLVLALLGFVGYVKWRQTYWKRRGVPYIEPAFFFGGTSSQLKGQQSLGESSRALYGRIKSSNKGQPGIGIYRFIQPLYMFTDPAAVKQIMTKDFHYFMSHGTYHHPKDILTMNLFNLEGENWKYLRSKLTPTFTSGKMKMMFETLREKTTGLEKVVGRFAEKGESFAIKDVVARFTTDIIASCAFGIECNSLEEPENEFRKYGFKSIVPNRLKMVFISLIPSALLATFGFKMNGKDVTQFFIDVVRNTIKHRETNQIFRKDFMHLLLQLKNQGKTNENFSEANSKDAKDTSVISENDIIAQCFIFFLAGFETSSTTMTFALFLLAQNPKIQEKLREEIRGVLDANEGKIGYDALMNMPYLDQVINETLRLYPPVPVLPRVCSKDYKIPNTNIIIEKGTFIPIPVWGLQMDPEYYPNPEVFDPERFRGDNKAPDFTFLPFGEGPRMCIGLRFGMMQTKVGLASLLSNFRFTLSDKTVTPIRMSPGSFILSAKDEVWLNVTKA